MYKKYVRKLIAPLMKVHGFDKVNKNSVLYYRKKIALDVYILIDIQKVRAVPRVTCNITISKDIDGFDVYDFYRLGDFLEYSGSDIWWSTEESEIEMSFIEISTFMQECLFPALEKLEDEKIVKEYLDNRKLRWSFEDPLYF
ncbi:hypothetical protein P261_00299 [Lachnospiraceae bacterium TWA4]|nr:hypothetical protein P261_00299 [Lachnospiraceae bacterium TWA4]